MSETPAAAPAAPAAPATPAAPAAQPSGSLIDAVAGAPAAPATPAAPAAQPKWLYAENTPGAGDAPEWFKADKYKTVEEQAKAYLGSEKLLGGFTGAPKDGYKFNVPEGFEVVEGYKFAEDPMFKAALDWGKKVNLNQEGFDALLGMWAQHNALPDPEAQIAEAKKALGDTADARITAVAQWGKANLDAAGFELLRKATTGERTSEVVQLLESVIAKTRQPAMPKAGDDVQGSQPSGEAAIQAEMAKKDEKGNVLFFTNPQHRARVEKMWTDYYARQAGPAA